MDNINNTTNILIKNLTDSFLLTLQQQVSKQILDNMAQQLARLDVPTLVREHLNGVLSSNKKTYNFPDRSIKGVSISPEGLYINASQIAGGIFSNFESTGIDDKATACQLTILDESTIFENQLVAKTLHVAGDTIIVGNLDVQGSVPVTSKLFADVLSHSLTALRGEMRDGMLSSFRDQVYTKIQTDGLDVDVMQINGKALVKERSLSSEVLFSNLQKVGALKELQVIGETLLDETVYISNNRVGINTINPENTLDLWDQEVQIGIGKLSKGLGIIGTPKAQGLILSSNKKQNLTLNPDGSVTVDTIKIGAVIHSSSNNIPGDDRPIGNIVWNSEPTIGSPIGWVSLGNARWAGIGNVTA